MKDQNLEKLCMFLEQGLIERGSAVRLSLLAALSGEHMLLLGPPGTAKSLLARKLQHAFTAINYFERLLTRFSVPEELFGPLSIKALEEDRYQRLTQHYLPEASIAFIDEIFKANSAILNSLLTLLNEREFDNGAERIKTPLICVVAASNELPEDNEVEALYDRFLFRYHVAPVSQQGFDELLNLESNPDSEKISTNYDFKPLSMGDIQELQIQSGDIALDESSRQLLIQLREYLAAQDVYISDRRWRKAVKMLQVSACTNQQSTVTVWDCLLLTNVLWNATEQIEKIRQWFIDYLDLDIQPPVNRINKLVITWEEKLDQDTNRHIHKRNDKGEYLYLNPDMEITTQQEKVVLAERDGDLLYLAPPDNQDRTNQGKGYTLTELEKSFFDDSYKQTHIDGRWVDVQNYINNTQNRLVNRIEFTPLTDDYIFSNDYVDNQNAELLDVLEDISDISDHFTSLAAAIFDLNQSHLWLKFSWLEECISHMKLSQPKFIDYHQRIQKLIKINSGLKTTESEML